MSSKASAQLLTYYWQPKMQFLFVWYQSPVLGSKRFVVEYHHHEFKAAGLEPRPGQNYLDDLSENVGALPQQSSQHYQYTKYAVEI